MHISETKPVWLLPSTDPFTSLSVIILLSFLLKRDQILLFSAIKSES